MGELRAVDEETGQDGTPDAARPPAFLSTFEAAAALGVNERTIRRAIARGELAAVRRGRTNQITAAELARYRARAPQPRPPSAEGAHAGGARLPVGTSPQHPLLRLAPVPNVLLPALSVPLTALVGREGEVAAIVDVLRAEDARLLTLSGPGGVGKTRLAIRVATELATDFADGVAFVGLAPIRDPALVAPAVAQALGVWEAGERSLRERLIAFLGGKELLLVLDNFEQVAEAAPWVADLLAACSRLHVLVTSRTMLRVSGERDFPVPPLALPDHRTSVDQAPVAEVAAAEAVRLFVERARALKPDFALTPENAPPVAAICRRLDGLPLAIELASARIRLLPPPALLARLERRLPLLTGGARDQPARLRTMRDAIGWSYDLLSDEEQALFRRLSIFAGGFGLEAAEAVCVLPDDPLALLNGIASLVDKSLLRKEGSGAEPRYAMLETIREFGQEQLAADEAETARRRHAEYYLALAEQAEAGLHGVAQRQWLDRLEAEHDNLRAALDWAAEWEPRLALELAGAAWLFWLRRGYLTEGRRWLERAVAVAGRDVPAAIRSKAWVAAAGLAGAQGDYARSALLLEENLVLARAADDRLGEAQSLHLLGVDALEQGDPTGATTTLERALAAYAQTDDRVWPTLALAQLAVATAALGDLDRGLSLGEEALERQRTAGEPWLAASSLCYLGEMWRDRGDLTRADACFREGLATLVAVGDQRYSCIALDGLASVAAARGQPERAARLYSVAEALREVVNAPIFPTARAAHDRGMAAARAALGDAAFAAAWKAGRALPLEQVMAEALAEPTASSVEGAPAPPPGPELGLSPREREVLRLLVEGHSDRAIAEALSISPRTASKHVAAILGRLGLDSRTAAATFAVRHRLA